MNTVFSQKLPIGSNAPSWTIALDPPVAGRFVRIRKYTDDILAITEVDVIPTVSILKLFWFTVGDMIVDRKIVLIMKSKRTPQQGRQRLLPPLPPPRLPRRQRQRLPPPLQPPRLP